jgi:hypothetical protein
MRGKDISIMTQAADPEPEREVPQVEMTQKPAERRGVSRSFVVRMLVIVVGLVVIVTVVVVIVNSLRRGSLSSPIQVELYPNAQSVSQTSGDHSDSRVYSTDATVQQVYDYYKTLLGTDDSRGCKKIYTTAEVSQDPGKYFARCVVDNSQDEISQTLLITIKFNPDANRTQILYERTWGG